jgi:hypothetical protein
MEDCKHDLRHDVFRSNKVDIMHLPNLLEFHAPFCQFFRCQIEAIALMGDIMILAEDAAKVAAGKED